MVVTKWSYNGGREATSNSALCSFSNFTSRHDKSLTILLKTFMRPGIGVPYFMQRL